MPGPGMVTVKTLTNRQSASQYRPTGSQPQQNSSPNDCGHAPGDDVSEQQLLDHGFVPSIGRLRRQATASYPAPCQLASNTYYPRQATIWWTYTDVENGLPSL